MLAAAGSGDQGAVARLYRALYDELHRLARANMRRERPGHTLQPTALVNEAYLRLAPAGDFEGRRHFFGAAAAAMRQVLVDHARRRQAGKRGAGLERVTFDSEALDIPMAQDGIDVLQLEEALARLREQSARLAELVSLRFYTGLSIEAAAEALQVSPATAKRDWAFARAWLLRELGGGAAQ